MRIEPLPAELEKLLKQWEDASATIKTLSGEQTRIVYNRVFEVQRLARGEFFYEAPDKGRIDLKGIPIQEGQQSSRINPKTQTRYRLESDQESKWLCNGDEILTIDEDSKTVEAYPLPPDLKGKNIIHGPLPFLFGMKAEEAKRRFELSFYDTKKNTANEVWITAKPRQEMDRDNFQEATIQLDRKRFLPLAVRLIDPSGNVETVYIFDAKQLQVNKRELLPEIFRRDPFHPNLRGYKVLLPAEIEQADFPSRDGDAKSNGNRSPIRQAGNSSPGTAKGPAKLQRAANSKSSGAPSGRERIQRSGN